MWQISRKIALGMLLPSVVPFVLAVGSARADEKQDEKRFEELKKRFQAEYKTINPKAPYKLFVAATPDERGAEKIRSVFDPKNSGKDWRAFYDTWFALVPSREQAEIVIDVVTSGVQRKPGYKPVYYMNGGLTVTGITKMHPIEVFDNNASTFGSSGEHFYFLGDVVRYMRDLHKEAVLAHGATGPSGASAASAQPAPPGADPGGWEGAKWGMTVDQVLGVFSGKAKREKEPHSGGGRTFSVGMDKVMFLGTKHRWVRFGFADAGGLVEVALAPEEDSPSGFEAFVTLMTERYGPPAERAQTTTETVVRWLLPGSEITATNQGGSGGFVQGLLTLRYKKRELSAAKPN